MRTIITFLIALCIASCDAAPTVSYVSEPLLIASGVRPSAVVDNHDALASFARNKLDGSLISVGTDSSLQMMTLLVACALGNQETFTTTLAGESIDFFGEAGLAPEWATRGLKEDSKGWVSACVLTHLSLEGLPVVISLRGRKAALRTIKEEREQWTIEEGAFFGNIFTPGPIKWFACKGKDGPPPGVDRSCAKQDPSNLNSTLCGLTFVGDCSDICRWGNEVCRVAGVPFREVITVRLQR